MSETPNDDLNYPAEAVRLAHANGFKAGQASCAPWMQHKDKCRLHPRIIWCSTPAVCDCGLDKHRAALRTRAGGER